MRDTSELPDATEQAKNTTKSRSTARSKPESTTTGNQDQETKPAARRRSPSTTHGAPAARTQHGNENVVMNSSAPTAPARPAHTQQNTPNTRSGGAPPTHHGSGTASTPPHSGTAAPQRSGGMAQRTPGGPAGPQRPPHPGSTEGRFPQRQGPPPQRPRPGAPSNAPTAPNRPRTGAPERGSRPDTRPGGHTGHTRPGGPSHPGGTRPGGRRPERSNSSTRSSQERRVAATKEKPTGPVSIPPQIMVKDLAELLQATPNEVIRNLIKHGIFANINEVVEYEKAATIARDLGFEPSQIATTQAPAVQGKTASVAEDERNTVTIPPVVTIMGHVDHGKTSLLDVIRKTKVAAGEAGGITQHIGAYQVEVNGKKITFLDTPGHEAFTAMRARGAQVTHIAIIVVAADDGVMPQTREAIDHARAAQVPIIIALNKIDKANANPDHVKQQLAEIGIVIEEYGGDIVCVPVSARKGTGIDELLDYILLVAEVQDIKANPNRLATGVIIEARLEKSSGPTATVLVQQGTLKMGDSIVVGAISGRVRAMFNDRGKRIQKAPPSMPVSIIGLPEVPQAGDRLEVTADERTAKQHAHQEAEKRRNEVMPLGQISLDTLYMQMQEGKVKELNIVLKCDVQGSAEALKNSLSKVVEENLKVRLIHEGIGNINETDIHLAAASGAIVIGFNVKADGAAQRVAQKEGVDIRYYNVIYKLIDDIQAALVGMLEPTYREVIEGHAEVLQTFKAGKNTVIAGCRVTDGKITRSSQARLMRGTTKVYDGKIDSLRRGKDDVREVATGYECGIVLEDFTEIQVGDIIEAFTQERVKPGA
ncbi:MAG TPA: translation initiation factor IF-2 [Ktedonobacteraceae bacterium]|nr:translation initiation factor IF-2 [Ktedonobacteraceae bacterium]